MSYHALWLQGDAVLADEEFKDLLEARKHVMDHLSANRHHMGVTSVKVCDERTTYFQIDGDLSQKAAQPNSER